MVQHDDAHDRDRVIADSGWGIKPDDQPANAAEAAAAARCYRYEPGDPDVVRKILLAQRRAFNIANRVRVEPGRTVVLDINGDEFIIAGLSYGDENLIELMQRLGAAFSPAELRRLGAGEKTSREYSLGRVWAWGAERAE